MSKTTRGYAFVLGGGQQDRLNNFLDGGADHVLCGKERVQIF